jgi:DNA helicase II / ATP-dependent DNA helicase PcrA
MLGRSVTPGALTPAPECPLKAEAPANNDEELSRIVSEEERCLQRIFDHVEEQRTRRETKKTIDYDTQLLELRDEIAAARMEDVPPLLEQMERLQGIAARQRELTQGFIDPASPYFGRMVLRESGRTREVLIGRSTYLNSQAGVRIVDWRDAPVSRLYYRYNEGEEYEENFGGRELEGEVRVRRSMTIADRRLRRIVAPQGTFLRPENGQWRRGGASVRLQGGQGSAIRAEQHHRPRKLGIGETFDAGEDKHLREITALIDPRQFELITQPDSGLVVIQGGAGSGKTTIGLHRLAYLAYQDKRRFRPDKMLVVVFNNALARYISQVLPALDINGVAVRTYEDWSSKLRSGLLPQLPREYSDETPSVVTRLKKHPALLEVITQYADDLERDIEQRLRSALSEKGELLARVLNTWDSSNKRPLAHRAHALARWLERNANSLAIGERHAVEREAERALQLSSDLVHAWVDVLTSKRRLQAAVAHTPQHPFNDRELNRALEWCQRRCSALLSHLELTEEARSDVKERDPKGTDEWTDGADGRALEEVPALDPEDDTLFLLLWQRLRGPLRRPGSKDALVYEHILVDEAQDLSPLEMSVIMGCVSRAQSVTLAGDVAQRLYMDNGFSSWADTLGLLGLSHVQIEPLKLSYRSTAEIVAFSRDVLGPLADDNAPEATRQGAPVELFRFADIGDSVGFLSESLRELLSSEPRAAVAVIARHPEQADLIYMGLHKAETPKLRRIADQDFPFKPGIDVTDVRQVKGLEFDYVVLIEVSESTYPSDEEARHLLHIAATRAAHQLWILSSGKPSPLLPESLRDRSY